MIEGLFASWSPNLVSEMAQDDDIIIMKDSVTSYFKDNVIYAYAMCVVSIKFLDLLCKEIKPQAKPAYKERSKN